MIYTQDLLKDKSVLFQGAEARIYKINHEGNRTK